MTPFPSSPDDDALRNVAEALSQSGQAVSSTMLMTTSATRTRPIRACSWSVMRGHTPSPTSFGTVPHMGLG